MERIGNDWYQKGMKKIEKDYAKSRIQNHECKGLWTWISTLIHSTYKHKPKPNAKNLNAALEPKNTNSLFP